MARAVVGLALQALDQGSAAAADHVVSELVTHPDLVDHPGAVDRAVEEILGDVLGKLWENGWQPADVARVVRRRLEPVHTDLLRMAVTVQARRYAADTLDARWRSQLDELAWRDDPLTAGTYLGLGGPLDRASLLRDAVTLLHTTARLPALEQIAPPPGTPGAAARSGAAAAVDVDDRLLERIRLLLAKAESTDYPAEAETFTAAAQSLMARHSIDAAVLAASAAGPSDGPAAVRVGIDPPYEGPKASLLNVVAQANRGRVVWSSSLGFATVVGFPADLRAIEGLFTSLLVQATRAMTHAAAEAGAGSRSRSRSFRTAFLEGFAHRIGERLVEAAQAEVDKAVTAAGGSLLPVLASRDAAVAAAVDDLFPKLVRKTRTIRDGAGWTAGRGAADLATLHGHTAAVEDR